MATVIGVMLVMVLIGVMLYDYMEISAMKYCVLKAMAAQSKAVDRDLHKLLKTRQDYKILNKDFKTMEKVFLTNLNNYLVNQMDSDGPSLRRAILKENVDL